MTSLDKSLRNQLERTVKDARDVAEGAARAAIDRLGVGEASAPAYLSAEERELRRRLRIHGHQLGDQRESQSTNPAVGKQETQRLVEEVAYGHWHRMLFAGFLAENNLLMYPDPAEPVAVSIQECDDLAADEGARNGWELAARFAATMLPEIFRTDSPVFQVDLPPEGQQQLERTLAELPAEVFQATDSLGWVYQFWQAKRKDEVNASEVKIGARELPAVTQLFTEDYMVSFLLDNTLGAWWAGKRLNTEDTEGTETETELRRRLALPGVNWDYLRFVREEHEKDSASDPSVTSVPSVLKSSWRPAAGTFPGWPKAAAEITVLDPCMGSGHFLVFALPILAALRTAEEGLTPQAAVDAVLRDNLFGLEIDPRCAQIAAFNLALAAWRMTGFHLLPSLNLACTGIGPQATEDEWVALAEQSVAAGQSQISNLKSQVENGLRNLHALFSDAPTLGSLIDPNQLPSDMFAADYETLQPYLAAALTAERAGDEVHERAVAAAGMVKAAELLAGEYTLVVTNVPYLGRGKQDETLKKHLEKHYPEGKADLATAFVLRCLQFCVRQPFQADSAGDGVRLESLTYGTAALVTPQNWLFLTSYTKLRKTLLKAHTWNMVARLGPGAFETISGHVVNVSLVALSATNPAEVTTMAGLDASAVGDVAEKAALLTGQMAADIAVIIQAKQITNPDAVVQVGVPRDLPLLGEFGDTWQGIVTCDDNRFLRNVWEVVMPDGRWMLTQQPPQVTTAYTGKSIVILWEQGEGTLHRDSKAHNFPPAAALEREGVAIQRMSEMNASLMNGGVFGDHVAPIIPKDRAFLAPIWCFAESGALSRMVRHIDTQVKIAVGSLMKVPFDLAHWQKVAAERYPNGLPEPESDDPTQWLFHGRPDESTSPLQVAVARLLGYRWPAELEDPLPNPLPEGEGTGGMRLSARARDLVKRCDELLPLADRDGLVCIPAVRGEATAADRLLNLLAQAYGPAWSTDTLNRLLKDAGYAGKTLETWLRDGFFAQHCELFHQRPFLWQIWDGLRDGFSILVNYHRLDRKNLETLLYTYLGDWIVRQKRDEAAKVDGAHERLAAAVALQKRLELILEGQSPYDIFVRWKPLHQQPIGWEPDLNDGVRLNIRPFMSVPDVKTKGAGVLRAKPKIKWEKDRGKEPERLKDEFPWFWGWDGSEDFQAGAEFTGERFNDCHYTIRAKTAARERQAAKAKAEP